MATAQDIIKRARRLIGSLGRGETPTDAENTDDLYALNKRFDALWLQRNAVFRTEELTVTTAAVSKTIGPTGDVVAQRPPYIIGARQTEGSIDYPITIITERQYNIIAQKSTTSTIVQELYYDPAMVNGIVYFYPTPSVSTTVKLTVPARLEEAFTINETVSLPPGYEEMMAYQLATLIAPEYQRAVPDDVRRMATTTLRSLKIVNAPPPQTLESSQRRYNIYVGD